MYAANGGQDGERIMVEPRRRVKRRMRDPQVLAIRDVLIVERMARGECQADIGRLLRIDQSLVSRRISLMPPTLSDAITRMSVRHPDGIPCEARDRFIKATMEYRERARKAKARENGSHRRTAAVGC